MTAPESAQTRGVRRRLPPDDRRALVLEVAYGIVAREGVDGLTMETLAASAGVSRPLLYRYFNTRAAVLDALYAREMAPHDAAMAQALELATDLRDANAAQFRVWLETFRDPKDVVCQLHRTETTAARVQFETTPRERDVVSHFTQLACRELRITPEAAFAGAWMQNSALYTMLDVWMLGHHDDAQALALYVDMVMGGWERLARTHQAPPKNRRRRN